MDSYIVFDTRAIEALFESEEGAVGKALYRTGLRVQRIAKTSMSVGGGRMYKRTVGKKNAKTVFHFASAPGKPPAVDTGRLRSSIATEMGSDAQGLYVRVGTNVEYALFLEYGTVHMDARPFLRPALASVRGVII